MSQDSSLVSAIVASRRMTDDGSMVVYNLTNNLDFSNSKKVADALAEVFFEKDASKWFKVDGDHIQFNPTYKVRILLAEEHNKLVSKAVGNFLEDLKKKELDRKFVQQIKDISANMENLQAAMASNAIGTFLTKLFDRKVDITEIEDDLFTDILEVLEIRTPSNADLIDWEHLPI